MAVVRHSDICEVKEGQDEPNDLVELGADGMTAALSQMNHWNTETLSAQLWHNLSEGGRVNRFRYCASGVAS